MNPCSQIRAGEQDQGSTARVYQSSCVSFLAYSGVGRSGHHSPRSPQASLLACTIARISGGEPSSRSTRVPQLACIVARAYKRFHIRMGGQKINRRPRASYPKCISAECLIPRMYHIRGERARQSELTCIADHKLGGAGRGIVARVRRTSHVL